MQEHLKKQVLDVLESSERFFRDLKDDGLATVEYEAEPASPAAAAAPAAIRPPPAAPRPPAAPAPKPTPVPSRPAAAPSVATPPPAARPAPAPVVSEPRKSSGQEGELAAIAAEIGACTKCPLHTTRHRAVPGQGNPRPELMFIGEGPGTEEDLQGLAFVGRAGALLTRLITRMGFTRDEVFIANIVKCRPTENLAMKKDRPPSEEEMKGCIPYLERQIAVLQPKVLVALGATAVAGLIGKTGISRLRGQWFSYQGIPLMPTYHPAYLLRGGGDERGRYWDVWSDMEQVLKRLGRPVPDLPGKPG